jgi:D-ribose pyranase
MKDHGVLHPGLAAVLASMGHGDTLCVADAGLPIPHGVERIDLAFAPGRPGFAEVLAAVLGELRVEAYVLAEEARAGGIPELLRRALPGLEPTWVPHAELKAATAAARAVVRSGEFTPYANVLLRSGVDFSAAAPGAG